MQTTRLNVLALEAPLSEASNLLRLRSISDADRPPWALFWRGNLLAGADQLALHASMQEARDLGADRLICFSGSLGAALDEPMPANWLGPGMDALRTALAELDPLLRERRLSLLIQPHARHAASDIPSSRLLAAGDGAAPLRLALAPTALLEQHMLPDAGDHVERILHALLPLADCLVLTNIEPTEETSDAVPTPTPITTGAIAVDELLGIVRTALAPLDAPPPVALLERDLEAQLEALRAAGYTPA